jgi:hypothetical protein
MWSGNGLPTVLNLTDPVGMNSSITSVHLADQGFATTVESSPQRLPTGQTLLGSIIQQLQSTNNTN